VTPLLVMLGAALGAPARYLIDRAVQARHESLFPWGTLTVNVVGSFILGFLAAVPVAAPATAFVGAGFCGALTTYSTFGYETVRLMRDGARFYAVANAVASVVAGLGAAFCGLMLASAVGGS
jgi:CrcB protein